MLYDDWTGGALNLASSWLVRDPNAPGNGNTSGKKPSSTAPGPSDDLVVDGGGTLRGGEAGFAGFSAIDGSYSLQGSLRAKGIYFQRASLSATPSSNVTTDALSLSGGAMEFPGGTIFVTTTIYLGDNSEVADSAMSLSAGATLQGAVIVIGYGTPASLSVDASKVSVQGTTPSGMQSALNVGTYANAGRLTVTAGSRITTPVLRVAHDGSSATISASSVGATAGDAEVSVDDGSSLQIDSGASLSTKYFNMGVYSDSTAPTVVVTGRGSSLNVVSTGYTSISNGDLKVLGGATVEAGSQIVVADYNGTKASIEVSGGSTLSTQNVQLGAFGGTSAASVKVDGANSRFIARSQVYVSGGAGIFVTNSASFLVGSDAVALANNVSIGKSGAMTFLAGNQLSCGVNVDGKLTVNKGVLLVKAAVRGAGTIAIGSSATFEMTRFGSPTTAPTFDFSGASATLKLDGSYTNRILTIKNFGAGDSIDFSALGNLTTFAVQKNINGAATGEVDVFSGTTRVAALMFDPKIALNIQPITSGAGTEVTLDTKKIGSQDPDGRLTSTSTRASEVGPTFPPTSPRRGRTAFPA